jgi:tryptophan halogenase
MKKIIVVGGGTMGWLTALFVHKFWQNVNVSVIASSKIDILGAGEGTTPNFPGTLTQLGIDIDDFMEKTGSTKKYGIDFINWRGDDTSFLHNFQDNNNLYALHFDARRVAKYLKDKSEERGIIYIDAKITGFDENESGITHAILEDGSKINCDFIFDCSGFERLIIGKHFKTNWKSYENDLVCNSAIAFFLPQENLNIQKQRTWTKGISMKHGWVWGAPLQHRWGCGYVYSDKYATSDEILAEAEEHFGRKLEVVKQFKFKTGTYEKYWVKNCVAIGLSSGFLEPLEATSLMTSIMFLKGLLDYNFDETYRDIYNERMFNFNEQNMLFIRHHYTCDRYDTKFWRDYKLRRKPKKLLALYDDSGQFLNLRNGKLREILGTDKNPITFIDASWYTVYKGKSNKFKNILI